MSENHALSNHRNRSCPVFTLVHGYRVPGKTANFKFLWSVCRRCVAIIWFGEEQLLVSHLYWYQCNSTVAAQLFAPNAYKGPQWWFIKKISKALVHWYYSSWFSSCPCHVSIYATGGPWLNSETKEITVK